MINTLREKASFCTKEHHDRMFRIIDDKLEKCQESNALFYKSFITTMIPYLTPGICDNISLPPSVVQELYSNMDYEKFEKPDTLEELMDAVLDFYEKKIMAPEKFRLAICALVLTFKGLTWFELNRMLNFRDYEWETFVSIFKAFLYTYKGFWKISHEVFIAAVEKKYLQDSNYTKRCHLEIAASLKKTGSSIRKLEELTNHLYSAKDYFQLKQTVASIEAFLQLFNPFTKYDQCRYWQVLEDKGYDPVVEYNKGLELFDMHYSPKADDLFTIILQISRFLKEFTDFETKLTPEFRHPSIKGKIIQLKEGNKKSDFIENANDSLIDMFRSKLGRSDSVLAQEANTNCLEPFLNDVDVSEYDEEQEMKENGDNKINYLEDIGLYAELKKLSMTEKLAGAAIKGHEKINVDVPTGRVNFQDYYKKIINDKKKKRISDHVDLKPDFEIGPEEAIKEMFMKDGNMQLVGFKNTTNDKLKDTTQQKIDEIDLNFQEALKPSFYYYKRWVWMIFPWICLSINKKQTFSDLISKCYSTNIRYLSVKEERLFTIHAIKIVMDSKNRKKNMLAAKKEDASVITRMGNEHDSPMKKHDKSHMDGLNKDMSAHTNDNGKIENLSQFDTTKGGQTTLFSIQNKSANFNMQKKNQLTTLSMAPQNKNNFSTRNINMTKSTNYDHLSSTPGLKTQSHKNTTMNNSRSKIDNAHNTNAKVIQILEKSQFWEDRLLNPGYKPEVKSILIKGKNHPSSLSLLNSTLAQYTQKEMNLQGRKNGELIYEYNLLVSEVKHKKTSVEQLKKALYGIPKKDPKEETRYENEIFDLNSEFTDIEKKVERAIEQQKRLERIIEICELNQIQNEEWIRSQNFYQSNLRKALRYEKVEIGGMQIECDQYDSSIHMFVKHYNAGVKSHLRLVQNIEKSINNQKMIDESIKNTNKLINKSVLDKKELDNLAREKNKEKDEIEKVQFSFYKKHSSKN